MVNVGEVVWNTPVGGSITANLAATTHVYGGIGVGIGHDGQILWSWLP